MTGPVRIVLTALGLAAVLALVGVFAVYPLMRQTSADQAAIHQCRNELVKLERVTRQITDLNQEIKRLEEALAFFEDRLPEQREIDVILREVWLIAEAQSLASRRIETNQAEVQARYDSQPITMTLEGRFDQFYEFLLGLERLPRITKVRQMQISKSPMTEGVVQVDLLMDILCEK